MNDVVLSVRDLKVAYGGIQAVKGIDLEVRAGELVTLIGANGAGKTTTLKAITGTQAWSGEVDYMGASTKGQAPFHLLTKGLTMVPEGRGVFARMSVVENLQMGAFVRKDSDGVKRDIQRMFEPLRITEQFLLKSQQREVLFRKAGGAAPAADA